MSVLADLSRALTIRHFQRGERPGDELEFHDPDWTQEVDKRFLL